MQRIARWLWGLCAAAAWALPMVPARAEAPKNIVFILTDDLDAALSEKLSVVKTQIAAKGVSFDRHYVTLSMCCPSRVSGFRGQFAHNTNIFTNNPNSDPPGGFEAFYGGGHGLEQSTFATWLEAQGYRTALIGKYLNGYPNTAPYLYRPPGWTEWISPVDGTPYDEFNYTLNVNGVPVHYGQQEANYLTDVISRYSVDFIHRAAHAGPFFAYVATYAPHYPSVPAPRHAGAPGGALPQGGSFNESDVSDKPAWVRGKPPLDGLAPVDRIQLLKDVYKGRRRSLLAIDDLVASILQALEAEGVLDDTYVIFASDNGYHLGQHRLDSGKMTAYEEDLRVPLVARGPGIPANSRVTDKLTANVDYAATFAEIAGASMPYDQDGRSLLALMKGQPVGSWRQALLLEHKPGNDAGQHRNGARAAPRPIAMAGLLEPADPFEKDCGGDGVDAGDEASGPQAKVECITPFSGLRTAPGSQPYHGLTYVKYSTAEFEVYDTDADATQMVNKYDPKSTALNAQLSDWTECLKLRAGEALRQGELAPCAPPQAAGPK